MIGMLPGKREKYTSAELTASKILLPIKTFAL